MVYTHPDKPKIKKSAWEIPCRDQWIMGLFIYLVRTPDIAYYNTVGLFGPEKALLFLKNNEIITSHFGLPSKNGGVNYGLYCS